MARQNYMTIAVADTVQEMFNEFISIKEITKTAALTDVIEMYMLAKDESLYLELKKKYLNVEAAKNMIGDRDMDNMANDFIFIKLGNSSDINGNPLNGIKTMESYVKDEAKNGYTWFSTQSLFYGMAEKQVLHYKKLIKSGETVKMLFAVGENAGGDNDIAYIATVRDIVSNKQPEPAPDIKYPDEYKGEQARIWIKLTDVKPENNIKANMLKVKSNGTDLKPILSNSQYHFGYVCFK